MELSGSLDMQFCFSILFFVLLTAWLTYVVCGRPPVAGGRSAATGGRSAEESRDAYAAEIERLKQAEKER